MSIAMLSTELLQRIYEYSDLIDILHLSQTSKRNYNALRGRRLPLLRQALDDEYGPIPSLVKLVISDGSTKGNSAIGTEKRRNIALDRILQVPDEPYLSVQLLSKMVKFGRVASRWVEIFPQFKWRLDYQNRRFLWPHEQRRLRRAIYNYWTYSNLFHDDIYTKFNSDPPSGRSATWWNPTPPPPEIISDPRLRLIQSFTTIEIVQLNEFLQHVVKLIELDLYPSDSTIQAQQNFTSQAVEKIAWGDGGQYRFLVKSLLRYNPLDLVYLYDQTFTKLERAEYMNAQGPGSGINSNAPATLDDAITFIIERRRRNDISYLQPYTTHRFHHVMYQSRDSCIQGENGIADHPHEENYSRDHPFNNDGTIVLSTDEHE
ncbi:hypothetical protein OCU04_009441 [Sclerotinia nivalis]|uniref:F-box domain-containing protein n=1 Tax=Sclerotinia nivalis TaxID=352851 RepID=A0A9X0DHC4_9HELO|nr:hypothetical protein OCU04_009441 [Sclerotinia nivalis]